MTFNYLKSACFTGHRPEKLQRDFSEIRFKLNDAIEDAAANGYTTFISGLARGVDLWAADIVIHKGLQLIAAVPYKGYEIRDAEFGWIYRDVIENADEIHYCSETYSKMSYIIRDHWMVDNSSLVIAVYHGMPGGTEQTLSYAKKTGKNIVYCG